MVRRRSGTQFDPAIVSVFDRYAAEILADIPGDDAWRAALEQAPERDRPLTAPELDELLVALGDFVDLKSGFRHGHSRAVAALAAGAGRVMGLPDDDIDRLRRAGAVHDLGRLGVSNAIWDKPTPLSSAELERVRLYPYLTQRILGRVTGLGQVAALAGSHRELARRHRVPEGCRRVVPVDPRPDPGGGRPVPVAHREPPAPGRVAPGARRPRPSSGRPATAPGSRGGRGGHLRRRAPAARGAQSDRPD